MDVLIIVESVLGPIRSADLVAVGFGKLAAQQSGGALDVLMLGPTSEDDRKAVSHLGARNVYVLEHADLESYTAEAFSAAAVAFLKDHPYRIIGSVTSSSTREYFPRISAMLDVPMASDVLAIERLEPERALFTRAVFVGNLLAAVELSGPQSLVTCRASEFQAPPSLDQLSPVEQVAVGDSLRHERKRFVALSQTESGRPELTEAEIIVSVGRGAKGPDEGIPLVAALADTLGAAMGATRAVVDAGWMPNELQVGQTGKIVAPTLYVAVGLSGAIQHISGMRSSKTIVAINKDQDAPIFDIADYGLVMDLFQAVPELTKAIEKR